MKAALVATLVVVAFGGTGLVSSPLALAALWLGIVVAAIPLRWTRVSLVPEGLVLERGFGVLRRSGDFVHESQIVKIQRVATERLHLLFIVTLDGKKRIELSDLPVDDLVAALEARFGAVEHAHVPIIPGSHP